MTDTLEFHDIAQEIKGAMNGGRLKLSKQGLMFKNSKTGKVDQVHAEDVEKSNWLKVARGYELKLYTNSGGIYKYDGFKDADQEKVSSFLKNHFEVELEETEMSLKGWNWGTATFVGSELSFAVDKKPAFHLPLGNVSHTTTAKNEVILEFHQNDDAEVSLMEMRFYVPPTEADANPVEQFHEKILAKADIIQATGDAICTIEQIPCLTPRGRYDLKIFPTFLQFHGKTFDYKIPFTTVLRLFLLPHKDNRQMYFVLSLDPPIVQGLTRYHFLILSFNKEDEDMSLELNLSEEDLAEKYQGKLQKEMTGASYELISRLMKSLTSRKITIPGSFQTLGGAKAINCSYKSNSGFLYPLERGFMFVHKPPIHIRFDEIACVNFSRGTGSSRYFDFEIETRNGSVYVFSTIDKNEYGPLFDFVSNKKLRVKNRGMKGPGNSYDGMEDSDDESAHDAYLEQMKQEGRQKEEDEDYDMNDEDDESDEDFNPDIIEASDVELEYDSNASESPDSDADYEAATGEESEREEGELKPKRHKESKKAKKRSRTVSEKPRKRRKMKEVKKDPNRPKRAPSAYMMWLNENREDIKKKVPEGSGVADVAKKAGEIWNKLETDVKADWQDKASEAKKVAQKAMMEYNAKKAEEAAASSDEEEEEEENDSSSTPKKKRPKKEKKDTPKKVSPSPRKAGSGSGFKSKEYISASSDSSSEEEEKKSKSKKGKKAKKESESEKDESAASEAESEKEESEKEESEKEESEKEESEKEESEAESEAAEESD